MHSKRVRIKKSVQRKLLVLGCLCVLILVATLLLTYKPPLKINEVSAMPNNVMGIPVSTELINIPAKNRPGTKRQIKYIVIHETGNKDEGANAEAHSVYLRVNDTDFNSWHYTVDETSIVHHIPDNEIAYHAGDTSKKTGGNQNGIGIELCVNSGSDFEKTINNAAKLSAYLMNFYGLKLDSLKQHHDFTGKECPENILKNKRSDEFKKLVGTYLKEIKKNK